MRPSGTSALLSLRRQNTCITRTRVLDLCASTAANKGTHRSVWQPHDSSTRNTLLRWRTSSSTTCTLFFGTAVHARMPCIHVNLARCTCTQNVSAYLPSKSYSPQYKRTSRTTLHWWISPRPHSKYIRRLCCANIPLISTHQKCIVRMAVNSRTTPTPAHRFYHWLWTLECVESTLRRNDSLHVWTSH